MRAIEIYLGIIISLLRFAKCQELINATVPLGAFNATPDPRFSWGHLSYGVPVRVLNNLPMLNISLFNTSSENYFAIDYEGVEEFVRVHNSPHYDSQNLVKKDNEMYPNITVDEVISKLIAGQDRGNTKLLKKRENCNNGYWHNFTNTLKHIMQTVDLQFRANWKEYTWSLATQMLGDVPGWLSFGQATADVTLKGSTKHSCNGGETWFNYDASDGKRYTYWVGYAPWTSGPNCDTTSRKDVVDSVLAFAYKEASLEDATAFCVSMTHEGTWHADVRIKRWEEVNFCGQSSWDIPCESFNFVPNTSNHDEL